MESQTKCRESKIFRKNNYLDSCYFKVDGPDEDNRFVYKDSTLTGNQLVTNGNKDFTGYLFFNTSASNQAITYFTKTTNALFNLTYSEAGFHEVYFMVWNRLSIEVVKMLVLVQEVLPIRNLTITTNKNLQKTKHNFSFSLSVIDGSDFTCLIDYGNGIYEELSNSYTKFLNSFTNITKSNLIFQYDIGLKRNLTKSYSNSGEYSVKATCSNRLTNFSSTTTVLVQKPIVDLALQTLPAFEFGASMTVTWDMSEGTNVSVQILYNNIPCCNSSVFSDRGDSCECLINDTSFFDPDEVVDIKAVAWNLVSSSSDEIKVQVLEKIILTNLIMLTTTSDFGSGVPGFGINRNKFPVEHPVRFNANYTGSEATNITWLLRCTETFTSTQAISCAKNNGSWSSASCGVINKSSIQFEYTFPQHTDQTCSVELNIRNAVGQSSLSVSADLDASIMYESVSENGPVKINESVTIVIRFQKFVTDTCLVVDLADSSPLLVYGSGSFCETKFNIYKVNPSEDHQSLVLFTPKDSSTQSVVIQHRYQVLGTYSVRINISNYVSIVRDQTEVVVLDKRCEYPNVTITGNKEHFCRGEHLVEQQ